MSRFLITTADESTWKFDRPITFLGDWCLVENRRHIWSTLDYVVFDPAAINDTLPEYFQATQELYELLLSDLSVALNSFHGCSHAKRYWNIIIGPWLKSFCSTLMFRWTYLTSVRPSVDTDSSTSIVDFELDGIHPRNFSEYRKYFTTVRWSQHVYSMIWNAIASEPSSSERDDAYRVGQPTPISSVPHFSNLIKTRSRQTVTVDSYLPRKSEIALRLLTGSIRLRIPRIEAPLVPIELEKRASMNLDLPVANPLHLISRHLVIDQIPSTYVEGYSSLVEATAKLKLPSTPRSVFTSNRHLYDDVFNSWVAQATENGSTYVIGQHGGYYGSSRFPSDSEIHEEQVADIHLTWGWKYSKKQLPGPCLKTVGRSYRPPSHAKHLLIVLDHMWKQPRSLFHEISECDGYLEYVARCVSSLPPSIKEDVLIRLHHAHGETGSSQVDWWHKHDPQIQVDDGLSRLDNLISKSRLVVSTSNGATFLETLNLNIPTLITWNSDYVQLRPDAIPYFQLLEDAGICYRNDRSFVDHVSKNWGEIELWWSSDVVQTARLKFCQQFSRIQPHPLLFLRRTLRTVSEEAGSSS